MKLGKDHLQAAALLLLPARSKQLVGKSAWYPVKLVRLL